MDRMKVLKHKSHVKIIKVRRLAELIVMNSGLLANSALNEGSKLTSQLIILKQLAIALSSCWKQGVIGNAIKLAIAAAAYRNGGTNFLH